MEGCIFCNFVDKEDVPRLIILEVAKAEGADPIVMGTPGRTGLSHVFFGSVAEHVVRYSSVPVLTARQEDVAQRSGQA